MFIIYNACENVIEMQINCAKYIMYLRKLSEIGAVRGDVFHILYPLVGFTAKYLS